MAPKRKVANVDISVNFSCKDQQQWYLDVHGLQGAKCHKVHLFVTGNKEGNMFDDLVQVRSSSVAQVDEDPNMLNAFP